MYSASLALELRIGYYYNLISPLSCQGDLDSGVQENGHSIGWTFFKIESSGRFMNRPAMECPLIKSIEIYNTAQERSELVGSLGPTTSSMAARQQFLYNCMRILHMASICFSIEIGYPNQRESCDYHGRTKIASYHHSKHL